MDHRLTRRRLIRPIRLPAPPPNITPAERARLERDYLRTHPPEVDRIHGCCDRVE